jgi:drug/metabolite transporter (DMT)-like permease
MRGRTAGTELSLVVAAILLGLNFVAIKIAVVSIPPLLVGALRFTAGGLLLLAVLWLVERPGRPTRGLVLTSLGLGLIGGTVFNAALNEGTRLTSASNAALIMATAPVWGMLLAAGLKVESLRKSSVVGPWSRSSASSWSWGEGWKRAARASPGTCWCSWQP